MNDNRALLEKCSPQRYLKEIIAINQAVIALRNYEIDIAALQAEVGLLLARITTAENEKGNLELYALGAQEHNREAWCADLTEDASGEVATIEAPNEPGQILIVPGGRAPADADGRLMMRGAMTSAQVAWNWAVLPGWQKWRPTYRVGTLTDKDDDMNQGTVDFDVARSTATGIPRATRFNAAWGMGGDAAGLPVNQEDPGWIEFEYMECDSLAFDIGDRVVVEFRGQDWGSPMIIGFESWPRYCQTFGNRSYGIYETGGRCGKTIQMGGITLAGPAQWACENWGSVYSSFTCQGCWKTGTISFSEGWIDIQNSAGGVLVGERVSPGSFEFEAEGTEASKMVQKQDGGDCLWPDDGSAAPIGLCPYYQSGVEYNISYAPSFVLTEGFNPVASAAGAGVIGLLNIPPVNFFDPRLEKGRAKLSGIWASTLLGGRIYAQYEPPEDDEIPPDP
jgi:hypothetical protein